MAASRSLKRDDLTAAPLERVGKKPVEACHIGWSEAHQRQEAAVIFQDPTSPGAALVVYPDRGIVKIGLALFSEKRSLDQLLDKALGDGPV